MSLLKELERRLSGENYKHAAPTELNSEESHQTLPKIHGRLCGQ